MIIFIVKQVTNLFFQNYTFIDDQNPINFLLITLSLFKFWFHVFPCLFNHVINFN